MQEKLDRVNKHRKQQFSYGHEVPYYENQARKRFVYNDMTGVAQKRLNSKLNGKDLR